MSHKITAIVRQFGSGGYEAAQGLSKQLGIPPYDRNLVEVATQRMGHSPISVEKVDKSALSLFLTVYQIPEKPDSVTGYGLSLNDGVYVTQTVITEAPAQKGPYIIVGRYGDYVLHSYPDLINVSIYADIEGRVHRTMNRYSFSEKDTVNAIKSTDRRRKNYYKDYIKREWGSIECHQVLPDISKLGMGKAVGIIRGIYETP